MCRAYNWLGFEPASDGDDVFRALVLARIIELISKLDSLRVLEEAGVSAPSYRTVIRRLPRYGKPLWQQGHLGGVRRVRRARACVAGTL